MAIELRVAHRTRSSNLCRIPSSAFITSSLLTRLPTSYTTTHLSVISSFLEQPVRSGRASRLLRLPHVFCIMWALVSLSISLTFHVLTTPRCCATACGYSSSRSSRRLSVTRARACMHACARACVLRCVCWAWHRGVPCDRSTAFHVALCLERRQLSRRSQLCWTAAYRSSASSSSSPPANTITATTTVGDVKTIVAITSATTSFMRVVCPVWSLILFAFSFGYSRMRSTRDRMCAYHRYRLLPTTVNRYMLRAHSLTRPAVEVWPRWHRVIAAAL